MGVLEEMLKIAAFRKVDGLLSKKEAQRREEKENRDNFGEAMERAGVYYWNCPICSHRNTYKSRVCLNCKADRIDNPDELKEAKRKKGE